ncbi:hypothetical protein AGMMS4956_04120 [Bacteroidia bacterium]|nr:hypothetical protein AGMMS4956_04120 [Bacteroidia bacterium]
MSQRNKEYGIASLVISLVGLLFVTLSGSVFSGYHFMDCSHFTIYKQELSDMSWFQTWATHANNELGVRFRPAWPFNTLIRVLLGGDNMLLQSFMQIGLIIIAAFLIYLLGRKLKWGHKAGLLLAGLTLTGTQSAIFYQTLAIETTALVFLLLSWHCILGYLNKKGVVRILYYTGFAVCSIYMVLLKENFILMLPASYVFYCMMRQDTRYNIVQIICTTWKTGLFLLLLTVVALGMVLYTAGSDFGYAGVEYSGLFPYLKTAAYLYGMSGGIPLALIAVGYLLRHKKMEWREWVYPILLLATITLPQIAIYAKSGIIDRYLIPGMMGCAYFAIFVYQKLKANDSEIKERWWKNISLIIGIIAVVVCGFAIFSASFQQNMLDFAVRLQGQKLQEMTSSSSRQYLLSTLDTMAVVGLAAGIGLLFWGCIRRKRSTLKVSQLYLGGLYFVFVIQCGLAFASHQRYAIRGAATENFLNTIIEHSAPNDKVLIVGNPLIESEGLGIGISTYLHKYNRQNLFIYPITTEFNKENSERLIKYYNHQTVDIVADKEAIRVIAVFSGQEELFAKQAAEWFNATSYDRQEFNGGYVVYAKK